jgi:hypothetical protein
MLKQTQPHVNPKIAKKHPKFRNNFYQERNGHEGNGAELYGCMRFVLRDKVSYSGWV